MGFKDEALFEKAYEEINLPIREVEGRGEFLLVVGGNVIEITRFKEIVKREPAVHGNLYFWFKTGGQRQAYRDELTYVAQRDYPGATIEFKEETGPQFMTRPYVYATLEYKGKQYKVEQDFDYGYPVDTVIYYWHGGNFSCDCNRRLWIEKFHPGTVPADEEDCGDTIECVEFRIELVD